jgi:hypothetical protein
MYLQNHPCPASFHTESVLWLAFFSGSLPFYMRQQLYFIWYLMTVLGLPNLALVLFNELAGGLIHSTYPGSSSCECPLTTDPCLLCESQALALLAVPLPLHLSFGGQPIVTDRWLYMK